MAPLFTGLRLGFGRGAAEVASGPFSATGGIIADISGGYRLHAFTQPGTFTVPSGVSFSSVEILMLGGGGGGGNTIGGGGGAGGAVYHPSYPITAGTPITVTAGSGGAGSPTPSSSPTPSGFYNSGRGTAGGDTVFGLLTAKGGGGGGNYGGPGGAGVGGAGGSSGGTGGGTDGTTSATQPSQPQGIPGFTQSGGDGAESADTNRGGGGGGVGGGGSGMNGGPGVVYPQFSGYLNTSGTFGGGGAGGARQPQQPTAGSGGAGGGGNGGSGGNLGSIATHGTGSGGGAGGYSDPADFGASGARGGNGVVLIKYLHSTITSATAKGHSTPLNGGTQWFASTPNHFGVDLDSEYQLTNGATYKTVTYRRTNTSAYSWWILFSSKSGNDYTPVFGARIPVSAGGSVGDTLTTNLIEAAEVFGNNTIPSSGTYYISWLSGSPNYTASSNAIFADATTGGSVNYVQTDTFPSTSVTYTTTSGNTGSKIHIALS